ncbi:MAG: hypothetical protein IJX61_04950, partial [Ruminococcus sp.]|nr:hypothetical protein [Ruminococcus sp.]
MRKSKSKYFNPIIIRIVGILLFISTLVAQGQVSQKIGSGLLPHASTGGVNGIISQIQVLIAVAMVV